MSDIDHSDSSARPGAPVPPASSASRDGNWERAVLEKLALSAIREQRSNRRWKIFFRFAFLIVLALIAWGLLNVSGEGTVTTGRHTGLVTLTGEISSEGQASAENIDASLESAFSDTNTVGVILRINSPGGSPVQAAIINREIRRLRAKYPSKPLYVVVDDMCASGGYYVAVAADKIFVDQASIVGSIGVLMEGFGFTGLMDKLGVERRLHTSGANKGLFDPFTPESDKAKEHAQKMLDQIHEQFIAAVKQGRGSRLKDPNNPDLFSGLFWTGQQSVELGLADAFGDTDYVARNVIKAENIVDYTVKSNFADRLASRFGASIGDAAMKALANFGVRASIQ
ncbi:S49 family peptidase [Pararobbsia alpina]|uniref:S49 family peptidase n=1 Tax=Pararobbsia alpina TaxID=621374 RepID=UPI0015828C4F|nr:S49 family peptidase [Pararobbsia alpina]